MPGKIDVSPNTPEPPVVSAPSGPQSRNWFSNLFPIIIIILLAIIAYFLCHNYLLLKSSQIEPKDHTQTEITPTKAIIIPSPTLSVKKESTLVSLDNTWNLYTNYKLGFSLKIPKVSMGSAPCVWNDKNGDHSYHPASTPVPVKVFEQESGVYLDHEYTYKLTGETKEGNEQTGYRSFFSGCEKQIINLDLLQKERQTWHIVSEKVTDDQELEAFIKKYFQPKCNLGTKRESSQSGVFDVGVEGDGKEPEESECWINYAYVLKYAPDKGVAFTWDIGQATSFYGDNNKDYDSEMLKSFLVL